jgi:DNA-binding transcriptional LysR family regulator
MAITLTQLSSFLAVVRGGSVTAAADELVVTQPSVSSALASLGRELGCSLFERYGRGIRLTEAGSAFAPYASEVLGLLESGRQAAREAASLAARTLRIAAVTTAAESFVPPLMRAFAQRHEGIELILEVGNRDEVLDWLRGRSVDVAFSGRPPSEERLSAEPIEENEIVCITAPDDPQLGERPLTPAELERSTWLLREHGSGTRALNEQFLVEHGLSPNTLTLGSNGAIKQAARAGLGISLISRAAAEGELASGRLGELALSQPPPSRPWYLLHPAGGPCRPAVEDFLAFVRAGARGPRIDALRQRAEPMRAGRGAGGR